MSRQRILHIRESIAFAKEMENNTHILHHFLQQKKNTLHHSIQPKNAHPNLLHDFIIHYIELVPDILCAAYFLSKKTGILDKTASFYKLAEDFFISPPEDINQHTGLMIFLNEAYFVHRLIEELNDTVHASLGAPIMPLDMTTSNVIMHDIIGENIANKLDSIIAYLIETIFTQKTTLATHYKTEYKKINWEQFLMQWPELKTPCPLSLGTADYML